MLIALPRGSTTLKRPSWSYLTVWYTASVTAVLLFPMWTLGFPTWRMPWAQRLPFVFLVTAFVICAGVAVLIRPAVRVRLLLVTLVTTTIFGLVFLGFVVARTEFSRLVTLAVFAAAVVLLPVPYLTSCSRRHQVLALAALVVAAFIGPAAWHFAMPPIGYHSTSLIKTEYYNLDLDIYSGSFPKSVIHGGALAMLGDRYLLMTGDGHFYVFGWGIGKESARLSISPLPFRVPINGAAFAASAGRRWATPLGEGYRSDGHEVLNSEWFRTYGLLVDESGAKTRIFVSHAYWYADRACWVERVSMLDGDSAAILGGASGLTWKTLFETTPCLPTRGAFRRHGIPFVGYFGGGRMALIDAQTLLLTVGDFGFDGVASIEAQAQNPATSYGKTLTIGIDDGHATLFSLGHRNPEGLYIDGSGTIWSTEHGPQGGDELNQLIRGGNYGWPFATDGTDYGSFAWPLNKPEKEQQEFRPPVFAWVPSIGISNLIGIRRELFSSWRSDLLVASLRAESLFRVHLRAGHAAYVEPINLGHRIRDLIEGHDGRIILWTDDDALISLRPKTGTTGEALFAEECAGCHQSNVVSGNRLGPNLAGVVGRRIASLEGYPDYSANLRASRGVWSSERLNAFIKAPHDIFPGTNMDFTGIADSGKRAAIVDYLRELRP